MFQLCMFQFFNAFISDYDVYNDAKINEDLINTAFYGVELQLKDIYI